MLPQRLHYPQCETSPFNVGAAAAERLANHFVFEQKELSVKKTIACCLMIAFASLGCHSEDTPITAGSAKTEGPKALELAGTYKGEDFSMVFENGRCFCVNEDSKQRDETKYLIRKTKFTSPPSFPRDG